MTAQAPPSATAAAARHVNQPQPQQPQQKKQKLDDDDAQPSPTPPSAVRLYVGGLAPDATPADVAGRFAPFGRVAACEAVPAKEGDGDAVCRGFAYVTLEPKDGAALGRCLSLVSDYLLLVAAARPLEKRAPRRCRRQRRVHSLSLSLSLIPSHHPPPLQSTPLTHNSTTAAPGEGASCASRSRARTTRSG